MAKDNGYFTYPRSFLKKFPDYSLAAKCLYTYLYGAVKFSGKDKGKWRGSIRDLAALTGMDKDSVQRAIRELNGKEINYRPGKSKYTPSEIEVLDYMTSKDYYTENGDSESG